MATKIVEDRTYKVITISMYKQDLDRLDNLVKDMKRKGVSQASRSALIRYAISKLDNSVPIDWCIDGKIPGTKLEK
jgi:hypothetical protein